MSRHPIRRALLSVYDKTGLVEFASALTEAGVQLVSTGSTAKTLTNAGLAVVEVADYTGFPECLDGRVKTLHPRIHAGILADRTKEDHVAQLADLDVLPFDLVAVNLYPFAAVVASGATRDECIEMIDIGGPTMVRAAAKNHLNVAVVTSPDQYGEIAQAINEGGTTVEQRQALALEAFRTTAAYDVGVATWLAADTESVPSWLGSTYRLTGELRYGENPHQQAGLYRQESPRTSGSGLADATLLGGKEMSYNNFQDTEAAIRAAYDQASPAIAIIKHANPCGVAVATSIAEAYQRAFACDPLSAFGGVVAANRKFDEEAALQVAEVFTEVVVAPGFTSGALEVLRTKKNLRIVEVAAPTDKVTLEFRQITGGLIVQERDQINAEGTRADGTAFGDDPQHWTQVAGPEVSADTLADLAFAWRAVRCVKSNAILLAKNGATVGVGMGQVNRVDSARLAVGRANSLAGEEERAHGAVASSDAFFPFADGLEVLIDAGVCAVVAPGGSVRDHEVIATAEAANLPLFFTGTRHFAH